MSVYHVLTLLCLLLLASLMAVSGKQPNIRQEEDHHLYHQGSFQYLNVPAFLQYEFGFNRGSPTHQVSRHEQFKNGNFRSQVKWSDSYEGVGGHYFEYNHGSPSSADYISTAPEYLPPGYYIKPADSKPAAAIQNTDSDDDAPQQQPIFDTIFRFPKPNV